MFRISCHHSLDHLSGGCESAPRILKEKKHQERRSTLGIVSHHLVNNSGKANNSGSDLSFFGNMHLAVILSSLRLLMLDQSEVFRGFFVVGCFSCIVVPFRILGFSFVPVVLFLYAVFICILALFAFSPLCQRNVEH